MFRTYRVWLLAGGLPLIPFLSHSSNVGAEAQPDDKGAAALPAEWVNTLKWRNIGPANMSRRITAIAVYEADPSLYWVATASGGLVKTTNNGVTFEHQFD